MMKDWFKTAFVCGCGWMLGKCVITAGTVALSRVCDAYFITQAKKGNKAAQDMCRKWSLDYESKEDQTT